MPSKGCNPKKKKYNRLRNLIILHLLVGVIVCSIPLVVFLAAIPGRPKKAQKTTETSSTEKSEHTCSLECLKLTTFEVVKKNFFKFLERKLGDLSAFELHVDEILPEYDNRLTDILSSEAKLKFGASYFVDMHYLKVLAKFRSNLPFSFEDDKKEGAIYLSSGFLHDLRTVYLEQRKLLKLFVKNWTEIKNETNIPIVLQFIFILWDELYYLVCNGRYEVSEVETNLNQVNGKLALIAFSECYYLFDEIMYVAFYLMLKQDSIQSKLNEKPSDGIIRTDAIENFVKTLVSNINEFTGLLEDEENINVKLDEIVKVDEKIKNELVRLSNVMRKILQKKKK